MTDNFDKAFSNFDKMFERMGKQMDATFKNIDSLILSAHTRAQNALKHAKMSAEKLDAQAAALKLIRDALIGKEGLMVEFTVHPKTRWEGFLEFIGRWKSKRVGCITLAPSESSFEAIIQEPSGKEHLVHVLHFTVISPLDAIARGV